jgi:hypothetical protein
MPLTLAEPALTHKQHGWSGPSLCISSADSRTMWWPHISEHSLAKINEAWMKFTEPLMRIKIELSTNSWMRGNIHNSSMHTRQNKGGLCTLELEGYVQECVIRRIHIIRRIVFNAYFTILNKLGHIYDCKFCRFLPFLAFLGNFHPNNGLSVSF